MGCSGDGSPRPSGDCGDVRRVRVPGELPAGRQGVAGIMTQTLGKAARVVMMLAKDRCPMVPSGE